MVICGQIGAKTGLHREQDAKPPNIWATRKKKGPSNGPAQSNREVNAGTMRNRVALSLN